MFRLLSHPRVRELRAPDRRRNAVAMIAMTGRGAFGLVVPWLFGSTVDLVKDGAPFAEVRLRVLILLGFSAATAFCQFWMRWLFISSSRDFEARLRNSLFEHLQKLTFAWFNRSRTGDILSRLTADVESVRMGVGPGVMHLYQTCVMALGAVLIMLVSDWRLTLIAMAPMALIGIGMRWMMPRMETASRRVQEQLSKVSELAQESFSGARVVKAFAREEYEINRFRRESRRYIDDSMSLAMLRARMHIGIEGLAGLVSISVLWFGGRAVLDDRLSTGAFIAFFGYFMMLVWPMIAIGWTLSLFQRAFVSLDRLEQVFATRPDIESGPVDRMAVRGAWSIRNLTIRHDGSTGPALEEISIDVPAGSSLAIVGPTGAGKSTLVQVLGRLFDPPAGTVFLDDRDVRDLDLGLLRRSIAMVPQDTFLFSDTIHANIAFARPSATREEVIAAARAAQVHDAVTEFENGYDQVIGERGITLSGGQKQRVAIARALLHDAPTLVLDDCLSAVDTGTEEKILEALGAAMKRRTTFIVAHRLSSVAACDRIIVIEEGRITESGTHDELLLRDGWYADTWRRQAVEAELEAAE